MRFALALPVLVALPLAAHYYPVSHGTLTVLEGGARLRLRLSTHHFQPVLERFAGERLAPKDGEAYPAALLERYFAGKLELHGPEGTTLAFTVVHQDLDATDLVVTLEVLAPSLEGWTLRHTVMMETESRQVNLVTLEGLGRRQGLTFDRKHPVLLLEAR